jgi:heme o synthase
LELLNPSRTKRLEDLTRWKMRISAYWELTKPRIVSLLVLTTLVAMFLSQPVNRLNFWRLLVVFCGGWLSASGAGALNHYFDRDIDCKMARTRKRPIPSGRVQPGNALIFGLILVAVSTAILWAGTNLLAAGLALLGVFYYVVVYTLLLKRYAAINVIIGGGAGAIPALVGWAAGVGHLQLEAWLLFAIVFFWSPPHSWALGLLVEKDYREAGIPVMPYRYGARWTRLQIVWFSLILILVTLLPFWLHMTGMVYLLGALLLGGKLFEMSIQLLKNRSKLAAKKMYLYTLLYLALLFLTLFIDKIWLQSLI